MRKTCETPQVLLLYYLNIPGLTSKKRKVFIPQQVPGLGHECRSHMNPENVQ